MLGAVPRLPLVPLTVCLAVLLVVAMPAGTATSNEPAPAASRAGLPSKQIWLRDVGRAMVGSQTYLDRRVAARRSGERLAVVLDIDNTSIASHYGWPRPVKKVRAFARRADALGVTVYFATGRTRGQLDGVGSVLRAAGYEFRGICTRRSSSEPLTTGKVRCRRGVERRGYTIIAVVGNRYTDMRGGHFERRFKLPSYDGLLS